MPKTRDYIQLIKGLGGIALFFSIIALVINIATLITGV